MAGPIGGLRVDRHEYGRQGSNRSVGSSVRSDIPRLAWASFDARQHDAQRQQEHRQSSDSLHLSACSDQSALVNPICETFREVFLNPRGQRDVKEGVVSEVSVTLSSNGGENIAGDLLSFDTIHTEGLAHPNPTHTLSHRLKGEINADRDRAVEDRPEWEVPDVVCETNNGKPNSPYVSEENGGDLIDI